MEEKWKDRVLRLSHYRTDAEAREYVALIDQTLGRCTPEVSDVLLQTFTSKDDFGVQESVVSVLGTAETDVYHAALLKALPRLVREAPKWADVLVGREVHFSPMSLIAMANCMDKQIREALVGLITQPDFVEFYPNATEVAAHVQLQPLTNGVTDQGEPSGECE